MPTKKERRKLKDENAVLAGATCKVIHGIPGDPHGEFTTYFIGKPHGNKFEQIKSWTKGEVRIVQL